MLLFYYRLSDVRLHWICGVFRVNKHPSRHCCRQMYGDRENIFLAEQTITTKFLHVTLVHLDIFWATGPLSGWGNFILEGTDTSCTSDYLMRNINNRSYVIAIFTAHFVVPVKVILISFYLIFKAVQKQRREFAYSEERNRYSYECKIR